MVRGLSQSVPTANTNELARVVVIDRWIGRELVALANERDGSDNISVQLVRVRSVERVGMYRGRPYKLR